MREPVPPLHPLHPLHFAIHDCNQRGGQDRSTLEIVSHLAKRREVYLHAFTFEPVGPSNVHFARVRPFLGKPALLKIFYYHFATLLRFYRARGGGPICATGACSLLSDIVHVQFVHAAWARRRERASPYATLVALYNRLTERLTFRPGKTYIAISHAVKADLEREYGLPHVEVVWHGVDAQRFRPPASPEERIDLRRDLSLPESKLVLLFVGSFERKGLATAIEALALLPHEAKQDLELVAVGSGDRARYLKLAAGLGISDQVRLHPPSAKIEKYFRAADAFLFPTTYEPFGLVILEAMASGLPTIVSRQAGAAELIRHGENGLLLEDPRDPAELANQLTALLADPTLRTRLGREARRTADARGWDQVAREYEEVLTKWDR